MRTTITLEPKNEQSLRKLMAERKLSFKDAVNFALRQAFQKEDAETFRNPVRNVGEAKLELDKALQIAAQLEDDALREKMNRGS